MKPPTVKEMFDEYINECINPKNKQMSEVSMMVLRSAFDAGISQFVKYMIEHSKDVSEHEGAMFIQNIMKEIVTNAANNLTNYNLIIKKN